MASTRMGALASMLLIGGFVLLAPQGEPVRASHPWRLQPVRVLFDSIVVVTPHFSPNADSLLDEAELRYALTESTHVFVYVSPEGFADTTAVLQDSVPNPRLSAIQVFWDGRDRSGAVAPEGDYTVTFSGSTLATGRTLFNTRTVRLDVTPPLVQVLEIDPRPFTPALPGSLTTIQIWIGVTQQSNAVTDTVGVELLYVPSDASLDTIPLEPVDRFSGDGKYKFVCGEGCADVPPDGMLRIEAFGFDPAGNMTTAVDSVDKNIEGPDVVIEHPSQEGTIAPGIQFADSLVGTATDRQTIVSVTMRLGSPPDTTRFDLEPRDGAPGTIFRFFTDISDLLASEGEYPIVVRAYDEDGVADQDSIEVTVDRTPPPAPVPSPSLPDVVKSELLQVVVLVDETDTESVLFGGGAEPDSLAAANSAQVVETRELLPGPNDLVFVAIDKAGNASDTTRATVVWEPSGGVAAPEHFRAGNEIQVQVGDAEADGVVLRILALDGALVRRFEDAERKLVYRFAWDLRTQEGRPVKNGAYLVVARVRDTDGGARRLRKMIAVIE
ncbi:MAG: hypothetical protein ACE5G2_07775 [Candidatus Krumholzibacteriia bacterium]